MKFIKSCYKYLKQQVRPMFFGLLGAVIVVKLLLSYSVFSTNYLEYKLKADVGSKVVRISNLEGSSGGTGFYVKAESGKTFILTNAHICNHLKDGMYVDEGNRKVVHQPKEISVASDLCIIEANPSKEGISLAKEYSKGERVYLMGHPKLRDLTFKDGEVIQEQEIKLLDYIIWTEEEAKRCSLPKNSIEEMDLFLLKIKVCAIKAMSIVATFDAAPGNSGSPVVNEDGDLIGVLFAGTSEEHLAFLVPLYEVKDFLKNY